MIHTEGEHDTLSMLNREGPIYVGFNYIHSIETHCYDTKNNYFDEIELKIIVTYNYTAIQPHLLKCSQELVSGRYRSTTS